MEVIILNWPAEARERDRYKRMGVPIILVGADSAPPPGLGMLEDYVRQPIAPEDLRSRVEALETLARATIPVVDGAGVLRFGGGWLSLSAADARMMEVLVDSFQSVVSRADLIEAGWPESPPKRNAVDLRIFRLRKRIRPLGLSICTVWAKGYLLDRVPA